MSPTGKNLLGGCPWQLEACASGQALARVDLGTESSTGKDYLATALHGGGGSGHGGTGGQAVNQARGAGTMTSVIVPCFNQLQFTRLCVRSLLRHTGPPCELVVVDNGSTDETAGYLEGVRDAAPLAVGIISNSQNRGFPAACNQGLRVARGGHLVLLNNDTVVTENWLARLVALAESDPSIGMVGPMSNYVTGPQWVPNASYTDLDEMHRFAAGWVAGHHGRCFFTERLVGFCLLIKRRVLETVGDLDERFGLGLFDDDDLSVRVTRAGFRLAVAEDVFVHHFGGRTFAGIGLNTASLVRTNEAIFKSKWGGTRNTHFRPSEDARQSTSPVPPAAVARTLKFTLTMIVRDEAVNLSACLESAEGLFDEIVVMNMDSIDHTVEVATRLGARVFDFVWVDDFAAARNAALARATGDYAFWLDADERIGPESYALLKNLFDSLRDMDSAYRIPKPCGVDAAEAVEQIRLFPCHEDVRWEGRAAEKILPALQRTGVEVRTIDTPFTHVDPEDPQILRRKRVRIAQISKLEQAECCRYPSDLTAFGSVEWLVDGSSRQFVPALGSGDFDPYAPLATEWVRRLRARVVVELGVRFGVSTRAILSGVHATGGHLWGVDLVARHGINDPAFTFVEADAAEVAGLCEAIDLLHIDTDPHTEEQTSRWFGLYGSKCRAIALHDTHHPRFGVGAAVRAFAGRGDHDVYEYWGNPSGWTVLVRRGESIPPVTEEPRP